MLRRESKNVFFNLAIGIDMKYAKLVPFGEHIRQGRPMALPPICFRAHHCRPIIGSDGDELIKCMLALGSVEVLIDTTVALPSEMP